MPCIGIAQHVNQAAFDRGEIGAGHPIQADDRQRQALFVLLREDLCDPRQGRELFRATRGRGLGTSSRGLGAVTRGHGRGPFRARRLARRFRLRLPCKHGGIGNRGRPRRLFLDDCEPGGHVTHDRQVGEQLVEFQHHREEIGPR